MTKYNKNNVNKPQFNSFAERMIAMGNGEIEPTDLVRPAVESYRNRNKSQIPENTNTLYESQADVAEEFDEIAYGSVSKDQMDSFREQYGSTGDLLGN